MSANAKQKRRDKRKQKQQQKKTEQQQQQPKPLESAVLEGAKMPLDKKEERELAKKQLMMAAQKRVEQRGGPDFGFKEGDLLKLKQVVNQLAQASNNTTKEIEQYRKLELVDKVLNTHWMLGVILKILVKNNLCTEEDVHRWAKEYQMQDIGLADKKGNQFVELGDWTIISFRIYGDDDALIEDRSKEQLSYEVGSNGLPIDDGLIGMVPGETRVFDVTLNDKLVAKEHAGKPLKMHVGLYGLKEKVKRDNAKTA